MKASRMSGSRRVTRYQFENVEEWPRAERGAAQKPQCTPAWLINIHGATRSLFRRVVLLGRDTSPAPLTLLPLENYCIPWVQPRSCRTCKQEEFPTRSWERREWKYERYALRGYHERYFNGWGFWGGFGEASGGVNPAPVSVLSQTERTLHADELNILYFVIVALPFSPDVEGGHKSMVWPVNNGCLLANDKPLRSDC